MIKLFGIRFGCHPLFSLLLFGGVVTGYFVELLTLFAIVLVHELGHVAAARGFGWQVIRVDLLPFGGVAEIDDRGQSSAWQEAAVALAGPLQNGWMVLVGWAMQYAGLWEPEWSDYFIQANLLIGLFNLLPVLPLDGGKVVQACVSRFVPYYKTVVWCSLLSLGVSAVMAMTAFVPLVTGDGLHLNLLAIALFLLYSNWYSYRHAAFSFLRFLMNRQPKMERILSRGTLAQPIVIHRSRTIGDIARLFMRDKYHLIYVMGENGTVQAVLPEKKLLDAYLWLKQPGSAISDVFVLE